MANARREIENKGLSVATSTALEGVAANAETIDAIALLSTARLFRQESSTLRGLIQVKELFKLRNPSKLLTEWLIDPTVLFHHADKLIPHLKSLLARRDETAIFAAGCLFLAANHKLNTCKKEKEKKAHRFSIYCAKEVLGLAHAHPEAVMAPVSAVFACILKHEKKSSLAKKAIDQALEFIPPHASTDELTRTQQCCVRIVTSLYRDVKLNYRGKANRLTKINLNFLLLEGAAADTLLSDIEDLSIKAFEKALPKKQVERYRSQLIAQLTNDALLGWFMMPATATEKDKKLLVLQRVSRLLGLLALDAKSDIELFKKNLSHALERLRLDDVDQPKMFMHGIEVHQNALTTMQLHDVVLRYLNVDACSNVKACPLFQMPKDFQASVVWMQDFSAQFIYPSAAGNGVKAIISTVLPRFNYQQWLDWITNVLQKWDEDREEKFLDLANDVDVESKKSINATFNPCSLKLRERLQCLKVADASFYSSLSKVIWNDCLASSLPPEEKLNIIYSLVHDADSEYWLIQKVLSVLAATAGPKQSADLRAETVAIRSGALEVLSLMFSACPYTDEFVFRQIALLKANLKPASVSNKDLVSVVDGRSKLHSFFTKKTPQEHLQAFMEVVAKHLPKEMQSLPTAKPTCNLM